MILAKSIAILTSGGDSYSTVNNWRKKNVGKVGEKFKEMGIDECKEVFNKDDFFRQINEAVKSLKCGDELILFFNGHGSKKGYILPEKKPGSKKKPKPKKSSGLFFIFDRQPHKSADRFLNIKDLRKKLGELKPCVKVYIAFHSCYSGNFIEELEKDSHVVVAVSSAGKNRLSHKRPRCTKTVRKYKYKGKWYKETMFQHDYVNWRNWPDGFMDGLKKGVGLAQAFQLAAKMGKQDAEKTGDKKKKPYKDNPQDFKRGHIEEIKKTRKGLECTLKVGDENIHVILPSAKKTNISGLLTYELKPCFDIEISGKATFTREGEFKPSKVTITKFKGKFHVIEIIDKDKGEIKVQLVQPEGLKDATKKVTLDPVKKDVEVCQWYTFEGKVDGRKIIATKLKKAEPEAYKLGGHVKHVDKDKNEFQVDIYWPKESGKKTGKLKKEGTFPKWMQKCILVEFDGVVSGDSIRDVEDICVKEEIFQGKIKKIYRGRKKFKVHINNESHRYYCNIKKVYLKRGWSLPRSYRKGDVIRFKGKCYGKKIRQATIKSIVSRSQRKPRKKRVSFGTGIKTGVSYLALTDFTKSEKSFDYKDKMPCYKTFTNDGSGFFTGSAEIYAKYHFNNSHAAGLKIGYQVLPGGTFQQGWTSAYDVLNQKLGLSAQSVPIDVFYQIPFGNSSSLCFNFSGGIDFYRTNIDYNYFSKYFETDHPAKILQRGSYRHYIETEQNMESKYHGDLKKSGLGAHLSMGIEYALKDNLTLTFDLGYLFCKMKNFKGTMVDQDGVKNKMRLIMRENNFGEAIDFQSVSQELGDKVRSAVIDLTGLRFMAGVRYYFDMPFLYGESKSDEDELDLME
jgi:hypothetical protein